MCSLVIVQNHRDLRPQIVGRQLFVREAPRHVQLVKHLARFYILMHGREAKPDEYPSAQIICCHLIPSLFVK
jgi:hypothetical protein